MLKTLTRFSWIILAINVSVACGPSNASDTQIKNGAVVPTGGLGNLYTVQLASQSSICTGVVVAPRRVVTAAHCVVPNPPLFVLTQAQVSKTLQQNSLDAAKVVGHRVHPDYANNDSYDIAVVVLDRDIPNVKPIVYASQWDMSNANGPLTLYGFGRDENENITTLKRALSYNWVATDEKGARLLVSHGGTGSVCPGDSGGPAVLPNGKLAGIAIWSIDMKERVCVTASRGVHISIPEQIEWIENSFSALESLLSSPAANNVQPSQANSYSPVILPEFEVPNVPDVSYSPSYNAPPAQNTNINPVQPIGSNQDRVPSNSSSNWDSYNPNTTYVVDTSSQVPTFANPPNQPTAANSSAGQCQYSLKSQCIFDNSCIWIGTLSQGHCATQ